MNAADLIQQFLDASPTRVDTGAILAAWRSLSPAYNVNDWCPPLPLWAQRPYDDDGRQAWSTLQKELHAAPPSRPMCIYVHVPFCSNKCGFCDSYSFQVKAHAEEHIRAYLDRISTELTLWSRAGSLSKRPVSSVHFGGGTPAFLGEAGLTRLVEICRKNFIISERTEWALETTVSSLEPAMLSALNELGFRRLHLGVQTMEANSRAEIGRRSPPVKVLEKVSATRGLGWVVSVDLICGLPYQTLNGFIAGIDDLTTAGVNGFSLYELLIYPQNHRWAEQHRLTDRDHLPNYLMFQAGAQQLAKHGFRKNLFNHWADPQDQNVYFTFPQRDEDCLAIGTIADGVFGNYHYRHPGYLDYLHPSEACFPGLEGGLRRTPLEEQMQPSITAIVSGAIPATVRVEMETFSTEMQTVMQNWQAARLVEDDGRGGLALTDSGSWFAGNMVADVKNHFPDAGKLSQRERPHVRIEKKVERKFRS